MPINGINLYTNKSFSLTSSEPPKTGSEDVKQKVISVSNTGSANLKLPEGKKIDSYNKTHINTESQLIEAIKKNSSDQLEAFFSYENLYSGSKKLNMRDEEGNTAVMLAVKKNDMELLARLEKNYYSAKYRYCLPLDFKISDNEGNSPLIIALKNRQNSIVEHLLFHSANNIYHKNNKGESAFTLAVMDDQLPLSIFRTLCNATRLDAYDEQNRTLLMKTVMHASAEKIEYALQSAEYDLTRRDANGNTVLSLAKQRGDDRILKLISGNIVRNKTLSIIDGTAKCNQDTDFHKYFCADRGDFIFGLSKFRTEYVGRLHEVPGDTINIINYYTNRIARRIFLSEKNLTTLSGESYNDNDTKIIKKEVVQALRVPADVYEAASFNENRDYPYAWREYDLIRSRIKKFDVNKIMPELQKNYDKYDFFFKISHSKFLGFRMPLLWKRSSKVGLEIVIRDGRRHLHFVLDGLDQSKVIHKIEDSVTASELRYIYRNRELLEGRAHFYLNYQRVPAPWAEGERFSRHWATYIPRSIIQDSI